VSEALRAGGYRPDLATHREVLYGGWLPSLSTPEIRPIPGLTLRRRAETYETRLAALVEDTEIGHCDVQPDLTRGGQSSALRGWAWLTDLAVDQCWRNRVVGSWLVRHAIVCLRFADCDRAILAVADENEATGAGRFYRRFGWDVLTREINGWRRRTS
jgi:GNAT superfamily N-acetyltransferase